MYFIIYIHPINIPCLYYGKNTFIFLSNIPPIWCVLKVKMNSYFQVTFHHRPLLAINASMPWALIGKSKLRITCLFVFSQTTFPILGFLYFLNAFCMGNHNLIIKIWIMCLENWKFKVDLSFVLSCRFVLGKTWNFELFCQNSRTISSSAAPILCLYCFIAFFMLDQNMALKLKYDFRETLGMFSLDAIMCRG